jgi:hypothetical protein
MEGSAVLVNVGVTVAVSVSNTVLVAVAVDVAVSDVPVDTGDAGDPGDAGLDLEQFASDMTSKKLVTMEKIRKKSFWCFSL